MRKTVLLLPAAIFMLTIPTVFASSANTQIVFSNNTTGTGDWCTNGLNACTVPNPSNPNLHFGFWYWCQLGTNGYGTGCAGNIYIYGINIAAIAATCDGASCVTSNGGGSYTLLAYASNGWVCSLTNTGPVSSGPHNAVTMTCTNPQGTGTAPGSVVRVS